MSAKTQHPALRTAALPKRLPAVRVGDMIQFRYGWGRDGYAFSSTTTRDVIEVIDGGARFVVQGFLNVEAGCVLHHIPMHRRAEGAESKQQTANSNQPDEVSTTTR
jgi:hypothetical protein